MQASDVENESPEQIRSDSQRAPVPAQRAPVPAHRAPAPANVDVRHSISGPVPVQERVTQWLASSSPRPQQGRSMTADQGNLIAVTTGSANTSDTATAFLFGSGTDPISSLV